MLQKLNLVYFLFFILICHAGLKNTCESQYYFFRFLWSTDKLSWERVVAHNRSKCPKDCSFSSRSNRFSNWLSEWHPQLLRENSPVIWKALTSNGSILLVLKLIRKATLRCAPKYNFQITQEQMWAKIEHFQNVVATGKESLRIIFSS